MRPASDERQALYRPAVSATFSPLTIQGETAATVVTQDTGTQTSGLKGSDQLAPLYSYLQIVRGTRTACSNKHITHPVARNITHSHAPP
ncbi:hypothetical protein WJX73_009121 [Symbiochloris irregularis]|uniref:Uncharacterized protein n=1 Tax=Symbiochloris irregularis TaxID=706552 RepID=A0AAW1PI72_9CHLO